MVIKKPIKRNNKIIGFKLYNKYCRYYYKTLFNSLKFIGYYWL